MPRADKPMSPTAQAKAERAARKQARLAKKARDASRLADLRERAGRLSERLPPQFQDWGVTKTRAYVKVMTLVKHKAALRTIKPDRLEEFVTHLERAESWSIDHCQKLSMLSDTAAHLEAA